jgi:hypothetical protein
LPFASSFQWLLLLIQSIHKSAEIATQKNVAVRVWQVDTTAIKTATSEKQSLCKISQIATMLLILFGLDGAEDRT